MHSDFKVKNFFRVSEGDWHFARKKLSMMPRQSIDLIGDDNDDRDTYEKFVDNPPIYINQVQGFRVDGDNSSHYFLGFDARILVKPFQDRDFPIGADILVLYADYDIAF